MSILERMRTAAEQLSPSERELVQEIIKRPRDVALGTASDLAKSVGVHEAMVSRLAKKLGFEKYTKLRDALRAEFIVKTDPAQRVKTAIKDAAAESPLETLVAQEIEALSALPDIMRSQPLTDLTEAIATARKVHIYATGNAETLAAMMERRLLRFGIDTSRLHGSGRDLAEQSLGIHAGDILLAFAFRRTPRHLPQLMNRARLVGARTAAISGTIGPTLNPSADITLTAPRSGRRESFQSLVVPMTICNAIILHLAQRNEASSLAALETLGNLIQDFEGSNR